MVSQTEIITEGIKREGVSDRKILTDLLNKHNPSKMLEGVRYYNNDGDIKRREITRYSGATLVSDPTKTNHKLANNWHKLLVDQKTAYLSGVPVTFKSEDKSAKLLDKFLGEQFDDTLCELIKGASNKGVEWLYVYINTAGDFDFAVVPAEEVIPIYNYENGGSLDGVIRLIPMVHEHFGASTKILWYNSASVREFVKDGSGRVEYIEERPHFQRDGQGFGWGSVPFIPFKNNEEEVGDLKFYKELIDDYDLVLSDLSNNLAEMQEVVTVLKGYDGTDLKEFADNMRYYKVIKVSGVDGSGVDKLEITIPIEAKRELLNRLEENIFMFGQGVNNKNKVFGGNPSGVALKFLYSLLDMKASITERKFIVGIKNLLKFVEKYCYIMGISGFNRSNISIIFGKRFIANDSELVDIAVKSAGIVSNETILAHHPWVDDINFETVSN